LSAIVATLILAAAVLAAKPVSIYGIGLVWHWEQGVGTEDSHLADESINPASVVKLATTLWAMEELGPRHRFRTTFAIRGEIDDDTGVLHGDLLAFGNGDPDFHVENAQLVARHLRDLGIEKIEGTLYVSTGFWIGWERGSEGRLEDPVRRASAMSERLASAWNPRTWTAARIRSIRASQARTGVTGPFIHLAVRATGGLIPAEGAVRPVLDHVSNPLSATLKRFNDHSNNDIERLGYTLGDASAMTEFYRKRWSDPEPAVQFETLSGLGSNRMTPRQVVRLMQELKRSTANNGLQLGDVLPALDCGRNTLRNLPGLVDELPRASLVGKTGTLVQTDGGVVALAGTIAARDGDIAFCVVAPNNGARMWAARRAQARWLLDRVKEWGAIASTCGTERLYSDSFASVSNASPSSRVSAKP
jgi:D-alanyl-D-alanine carboxypeptidase/D-alanyl-D-alanine-endopeptidase (penicillin-binding protein 4)